MAITASYCTRNSSVNLTLNSATASQTIGYADKPDERILVVAQNANTGDGQTATITISKGDFLGSVSGDLVVTVAKGASAVIGPLESVRFKNSASEIAAAVAVTASGTVSNVKLAAVKLP
jgi:hypothetical protein